MGHSHCTARCRAQVAHLLVAQPTITPVPNHSRFPASFHSLAIAAAVGVHHSYSTAITRYCTVYISERRDKKTVSESHPHNSCSSLPKQLPCIMLSAPKPLWQSCLGARAFSALLDAMNRPFKQRLAQDTATDFVHVTQAVRVQHSTAAAAGHIVHLQFAFHYLMLLY